MQCPKCRAAMPNGAKYCTECGAKLPVQPDSVPNVPQPAIQEAPAYEAQPVMTEAASAVQERPVKLKWFKFLIYFALWSGGILTALYSFAYFTGTVLGIGIDTELVYSYYPLLRVFHISAVWKTSPTASLRSTRATGWRSSAGMARPVFTRFISRSLYLHCSFRSSQV